MGITSLEFGCFVFLVCIVYYLLPVLFWKKCILLAANFLFYLSFQTQDIAYLVFIMLFSYFAGFILEKKKLFSFFVVSILGVLAGLCFFKYANYFLSVPLISNLLPDGKTNFAAPLGLSFYTFKVLGYLIDIYLGKSKPEKSLLNFAVYVSFFPQISSGPIHKASSFFNELKRTSKWNYDVVRNGFQLIFFGLFEKMVIADRLNLLVQQYLTDLSNAVPATVLIGCIAYSFQIYADFDAYSNIANGLSGLFGFQPVANFNAPYLSRSVKEFWGKWHISLSSWLKEYIYFPLGGNRKGTFRKYINLMIVFLVSGFWHGATWNFILWGLLNGLCQVIYDIIVRHMFKGKRFCFPGFTWWLEISFTFALTTLLWIFFRCSSIDEIRMTFSLLSQLKWQVILQDIQSLLDSESLATWIMTSLLIGADVLRAQGFTVRNFGKLFFPIRWAVYLVMIVLMILFSLYGPGYDPSKFIYLEF